MQFGVTDHVDASGIPPAEVLEERLRLVEVYDRPGRHFGDVRGGTRDPDQGTDLRRALARGPVLCDRGGADSGAAGAEAAAAFPHTFELWQQAGGAFAGTPEDARAFVAQQVEVAGLDTMNFHLAFGDIGFDDVCRTAELFAAEVMPEFADAGTLR